MEKQKQQRLSLVLGIVFMATTIVTPGIVLAQNLPLVDKKESSELTPPERIALPKTEEKIDKSIAQLQTRLADLRQQTGTSAESMNAEKGALLLATPEEQRKRERLISELIIMLDKQAQVLRELKEIRRVHNDHTAEIKAWKGFSEKPPFPISFLDNLRDALLAQKLDKQTLDMRLAIAKGDLQLFTKRLRESQKDLRLAEERFERSKGRADEARLLWLRDLSQLQNSLNEAGAASSETQRLIMEEALSDKNEYIGFLEQKVALAEKVSPLSKEDLEQKLGELDSQRKTLEDELHQALKKDDDAKKRLQQTRDAFSKAQAELTSGLKPTPKDIARVSLLQSMLEAQQALVEAASEKVDVLKGLLQLVGISQTVWEDRYELTQTDDLTRIKEIYEFTGGVLSSMHLWSQYIQNRLSSWATLTRSQRDKIETSDKTEEERQTDRIILKAYEERQAMLIKGAETLARVERLANRLRDELTERKEHAQVESHIKELFTIIQSFIKRVWNTELYVAEQTIIAEGNKIVKPVSVTVGKAIQACIILIAGTWVARWLIRPVRWIVTKKFRRDESIAQQIGKVTFLILFLVVMILSLISVNIPLAVFAFFGGALAIGVGFGAQNIINNFISSFILLFDRSIKVGDIIEVDGQGGRVISIGMRSSHIMGFDGVEFLVPNSQFLQQKVTNWTLSVKCRRYPISVGVAYGSPTQEVSKLILKAV
ncbi:MAG TPA: hypothetical protein DCP92_09970, partial [Nitrospiraceae bacterium]|nr:hypothetical protein [Nitrospiraceae bacterium]